MAVFFYMSYQRYFCVKVIICLTIDPVFNTFAECKPIGNVKFGPKYKRTKKVIQNKNMKH